MLVPASLHRAASGAAFVKWCGLLIDVASLEVQGDYTRWVGGFVSWGGRGEYGYVCACAECPGGMSIVNDWAGGGCC